MSAILKDVAFTIIKDGAFMIKFVNNKNEQAE